MLEKALICLKPFVFPFLFTTSRRREVRNHVLFFPIKEGQYVATDLSMGHILVFRKRYEPMKENILHER